MALSRSASPALSPACDTAVRGRSFATNTTAPLSPDPTTDPFPSESPSSEPTSGPTSSPTCAPSQLPSNDPSYEPSGDPSNEPSNEPSGGPKPPAIPERKCSTPPKEEEIKALLEGWNIALQHVDDSQKIADLYDKDNSILLSTLKPKVFKKRENIKTYFDDFLKLKPTAKVDEDNRVIHILGDKGASDTGLYTFTFGDGKTAKIDARFTFVYKVVDGACVIMSHHSSKLPVEEKKE